MLVKCESLNMAFVVGCSWPWLVHLNFLNVLPSKARKLLFCLLLPEAPVLSDLSAGAQAIVHGTSDRPPQPLERQRGRGPKLFASPFTEALSASLLYLANGEPPALSRGSLA